MLFNHNFCYCHLVSLHRATRNLIYMTFEYGAAMVPSVEHPAPHRTARVRSSHGETPPCTLMAPGSCKIRRGCSVFLVPIQNYTPEDTKAWEPSHSWRIKIVIACLQTIPRDESQTVGNSSLRCSNPTLNPTYQSTLSYETAFNQPV